MPREVSSFLEVCGVSGKELFSLVYGSRDFLLEYQRVVNQCLDARVPDFQEQDGGLFGRMVEFSLPINAPSVVMRLVGGSDRISVKERQCVEVLGDGTIVLTSQPRPQIGSLSDGFTSDAEVRICDAEDMDGGIGCRVLARVTVAAHAAPYGTVTMIEKFMSDTALESLDKLLRLMEAHVVRVRGEGRGALEGMIRETVAGTGALHAYIGFEEGENVVGGSVEMGGVVPRSLTDDTSTLYFDDRNDDILHAIDGVQRDIQRLAEQVARMQVVLDGLDTKMGTRDMPLRVSLRFELMPIVLTASVAGAMCLALYRNWR